MNKKSVIKYLVLYIIFNLSGFFLASNFWWTDSLKLSYLKKESFLILISVQLCWIGIFYLSMLIIRKFILKEKIINFLGPLDFEDYYKQIGNNKSKKFKNLLALISFPTLIFTIISFVTSMNCYKKYELSKYGKIEKIKVKELKTDIKNNQYIYFEYNNKKNNTNLPNTKNYSIGNEFNIIYSIKNPKIIELSK